MVALGVNTPAGPTGTIRATCNITAGYSDDRLKTRTGPIANALCKVNNINGFYYVPNSTAVGLGYPERQQVGLSAQEVQRVMPEVVVSAPISDDYLTIQYEKLTPLLIEAIKELNEKVDNLRGV